MEHNQTRARVSMGLGLRLTVVFVGTLGVLLAVLCLVIVVQINRIVIPLTEGLGSEVVRARAAQVGQWVAGKLDIIEVVSRLDVHRAGDIAEIRRFMDTREADKDPEFFMEVYTAPDGNGYTSQGADVALQGRDYYKAIVLGGAQTYTTNAMISTSTGKPIVGVATAIKDFSGATNGLLLGTVTMDKLTEIVSDLTLGDSGYGWIVDGAGLVLAHPVAEYRVKLNINKGDEMGFQGLDAVAAGVAAGGVARVRTPAGALEVVLYQPIPGTPGWVFAVSLPAAEITRDSNLLNATAVIMSLLILLVAAVVSMAYASRIARPVRFLADKANRFAQGQITLSEEERRVLDRTARRRDEIGLVGRSFGQMTDYLQDTVRVARAIAAGDLTVDVAVRSEDDQIGTAHVEMVGSLSQILGGVRASVAQVTGGADQISHASQSLSQGAAEQASALEEIASSLTEINAQSRENAQSAAKANELAREAAESAHSGKSGMDDLRQAMHRVSESSSKIGTIVKVIDDIAFQINLLALNANVEAARAGKYGKGFAVVADEVRSLAVRSTQAVKETNGMVEDATRAIEGGAKTSEAAAAKLEQIVRGTTSVADILAGIARASRDQADKVEQSTAGLDQINQVTQSNTSSAEQSAAASLELASQAKQLETLVTRFRLT